MRCYHLLYDCMRMSMKRRIVLYCLRERETKKKQQASLTNDRKEKRRKKKEVSIRRFLFLSTSHIDSFQSVACISSSRSEDYHYSDFY